MKVVMIIKIKASLLMFGFVLATRAQSLKPMMVTPSQPR